MDEAVRWLAPGCLVAGVLLGVALQLTNGFLQPSGLALVTAALAVLLFAVVTPRSPHWRERDLRIVQGLAVAGLLVHEYALITSLPGVYTQAGPNALRTFQMGVLVLAVLAALLVLLPRTRMVLPLAIGLIMAHAFLGHWVIQHSLSPGIDVHLFQRHGVAALLQGHNPYAMTFPDIYNHSLYYGEGLSVDGRLQFGFPYFPLSLLAAVPGEVLGHDPRYSQLAAMEITALLMVLARPGGLGAIAAALHLTTPRIFYVLEQSWTEPFVVLGAAAVVVAACRAPRLTPWLFGAFVAIKQYLVFALPAAVLLVRRADGLGGVARFLARAALVGAAITLPFVLWDPSAFVKSVVTLQMYQPFRLDALSYLSWWVTLGHPQPSTAIPFVLASAAAALAVWRSPRTGAGFAAALALTFLVFFAFNKQAFANYYSFALGTSFLAVAAWRPPFPDGDPPLTP
ncbi:MAG: hypothetical protein U0P30_10395 [Vicinamibacterales bacterium]